MDRTLLNAARIATTTLNNWCAELERANKKMDKIEREWKRLEPIHSDYALERKANLQVESMRVGAFMDELEARMKKVLAL